MGWSTLTAFMVASSVPNIGDPDHNGAVTSIVVGTYPAETRERLVWDASSSRWIGKVYKVIDQIDADPLTGTWHPTGLRGADWSYVGSQYATPTWSWGYKINWLRAVNKLYDAGLRLQERLSARLGDIGEINIPEIVAFYYQWDAGDNVNYAIPPDAISDPTHLGFGTSVQGLNNAAGGGTGTVEVDGGWKDLALRPTKDILYPDLYVRTPGTVSTNYPKVLNAQMELRWVASP